MVETNEGIVQFCLDPMPNQPFTRGKGAGRNVNPKNLTMYLSEMTFCNYPQLLLIFPQRQTQVEMMGKKTTQASHRALLFEEVLILYPHDENTDQHPVEYTLIAFTVFSEKGGRGHYQAYCKKGDTEWYLCNDDKITKKRGDFATMTTTGSIGTQVTSLYYLRKEEATINKYAKKAQEDLDQGEHHGCDYVGTEERDLAQIQKRGGEETTTQENLDQEEYHGNDVAEEKECTYAPTTAPIESTTDLAQIQKRGGEETTTQENLDQEVLHGNDVEEEEERPFAPTTAPIDPTTAVGTSNGAYISYSAQHNNIHRSH